jgi:hypothetical protein
MPMMTSGLAARTMRPTSAKPSNRLWRSRSVARSGQPVSPGACDSAVTATISAIVASPAIQSTSSFWA